MVYSNLLRYSHFHNYVWQSPFECLLFPRCFVVSKWKIEHFLLHYCVVEHFIFFIIDFLSSWLVLFVTSFFLLVVLFLILVPGYRCDSLSFMNTFIFPHLDYIVCGSNCDLLVFDLHNYDCLVWFVLGWWLRLQLLVYLFGCSPLLFSFGDWCTTPPSFTPFFRHLLFPKIIWVDCQILPRFSGLMVWQSYPYNYYLGVCISLIFSFSYSSQLDISTRFLQKAPHLLSDSLFSTSILFLFYSFF